MQGTVWSVTADMGPPESMEKRIDASNRAQVDLTNFSAACDIRKGREKVRNEPHSEKEQEC